MEWLAKRTSNSGLNIRNASSRYCSFQKILLIDNPFPRILERKKDVVKVDDHSGLESRENFEYQEVDIGADPGDVRAVYKEKVAWLKRIEDLEWCILCWNGVHSSQTVRLSAEEFRWEWLDARNFSAAIELYRVKGNKGRISASDFDDVSRLKMADHRVVD